MVKDEAQDKVDNKKTITSRLNMAKARQAKLDKLAQKRKQKENTQEVEYSDSDSEESESESESDEDDVLIIKPSRRQTSIKGRARRPKKVEQNNDDLYQEIDELKSCVYQLKMAQMKQKSKQKAKPKKTIQIVNQQPSPIKSEPKNDIDDTLKYKILNF